MKIIVSSNHKLFKDSVMNDFLKESMMVARSLDTRSYDKLMLNEDFFSIPQNTLLKDSKDCIYESHKKYIDIHIVVEGKEAVELIDLAKSSVVPYEANYENDYFLYHSDTVEKRIILDEIQIAVFDFDDVHKVGIKSTNDEVSVRKVVLKVTKSLFEREFINE